MCFYRADEVSTSEVVQQELSQSASDAHAELPSSVTSPFTRHGHGRREEEAFRALNSRSFFLLFFSFDQRSRDQVVRTRVCRFILRSIMIIFDTYLEGDK